MTRTIKLDVLNDTSYYMHLILIEMYVIRHIDMSFTQLNTIF